jgi:hypothetical protein
MEKKENDVMKKETQTTTVSGGIGFTGLLTIVFIILRLIPYGDGHIINWSWWWVLSPLWINVLLVIAVVLIATIVTAIGSLGDKYE